MAFESGKKSAGLAYVLWFFFGGLGIHRFYLGHVVSGLILLLITVIGVVTLFPLIITAIWFVIDLFLIPGMARNQNEALMGRIRNGLTR